MVQSAPETEEDGMEVDNPDDEQAHLKDRHRPPKRGRDMDAGVEDAHGEPHFKRPRIATSPEPSPSDLNPSSSSSSSFSTAFSASSSAHITASTGTRLIRTTLDTDSALEIRSTRGPDMKKAARLLFGETATEWLAGYSLIQIAGLSPELEQLLSESQVCVLWNAPEEVNPPGLLLLATPESDRERLGASLLQWQFNEQTIAEADDSDDDDSELEEEFRQFPIGKHCTALMLAATLGDDELMRTLLENGADPNKRDCDGATALIVAARHGRLQAVRTLLHAPATKVNLKDTRGHNALSAAAAQGHLDICDLLLGFGDAHLERQSPVKSKHPLLLAARQGHSPICELIIKQGVDIDIADSDGRTALWHAAERGQTECCEWLIDAGANPNHVSTYCGSILMVAVDKDDLGLLNRLLEWGADPTGDTAPRVLNAAAGNNCVDIVKRLISLGIDVNATYSGQTALNHACQEADTDVSRLLLEAGANPNIPDSSGMNGLVHAAKKGRVELLNLLIKYGAQLRSKWHFGYHALYEATQHGKLDAMQILLRANAPTLIPIDQRWPGEKRTPLLSLVMNTEAFPGDSLQLDAFRLLLMHRASWQEVDAQGNDVLMRATVFGHTGLLELLFHAGATVGQKNAEGLNALEIAAHRADLALAAACGPVPPELASALITLLYLMEAAKRQSTWISLRMGAIDKAEHPITRETLCQDVAPPDRPLGFSVHLDPYKSDITRMFLVFESALRGPIDDWDRRTTETALAQLGVPIPAIDFYCAHIQAFPAMKAKLFGPNADIAQDQLQRLYGAITANMERLLIAPHDIEDAYEALGWQERQRLNLAYVARIKISEISALAIEAEQSLQTVFANLFEDCLESSSSIRGSQTPPVGMPPTPRMIAAELMRRGVYAALAQGIEEAWRIACIETAQAGPATASSSSSAGSDEIFSRPVAPAQLAAPTASSTDTSDGKLGNLQASQLLSAFRKALSTIVDSASLLKLAGASPEAAGLYADLMHRQLHMLVQFIRAESEVEVDLEPAPAAAAPAPTPTAALAQAPDLVSLSEMLESTAPEEWSVPEEWLLPADWL
jgi:ankyrin repeat protein